MPKSRISNLLNDADDTLDSAEIKSSKPKTTKKTKAVKKTEATKKVKTAEKSKAVNSAASKDKSAKKNASAIKKVLSTTTKASQKSNTSKKSTSSATTSVDNSNIIKDKKTKAKVEIETKTKNKTKTNAKAETKTKKQTEANAKTETKASKRRSSLASKILALLDDVSEETKKTIEKASKAAKKVATAAKEASKKTSAQAKELYKDVSPKVKKAYDDAAPKIQEAATKTQTTAKKIAKKVKDNVAEGFETISEKVNRLIEENDIRTFNDIPEYYDLPYRYDNTVVKILAQNPETLFVYWDINDHDKQNFINTYGENFFNETYPVLVVHNLTNGYSFEIGIDDFANNWYIHVNDTKCKYAVELGRRPHSQKIIENKIDQQVSNFVNITFSNTIEMPNDHVLFFKDHDKIYFKNIKTNNVRVYEYNKKRDNKNLKDIYKNYDLSDENNFDMKNPSSGNPTSTFK